MRYTVSMTIEADSLTDAWDKLPSLVPGDLRPESVATLLESGLLSFTLNGGGKEVHATFLEGEKKQPLMRGTYEFPPTPVKDDKAHVTARGSL